MFSVSRTDGSQTSDDFRSSNMGIEEAHTKPTSALSATVVPTAAA